MPTTLVGAIQQVTGSTELLDRIVAQALALFEDADGASLEVRRSGDWLEYVSAAGSLAPFVGLVLPVTGSLSGLALTSGMVQRCDDALIDGRVDRAAVLRTSVRSILCVPLSGGAEGSVAVLKVSSTRPGAFRTQDIRALERLVDFVGVALGASASLARVTAAVLSTAPGQDADEHARTAKFVANVISPDLAADVADRREVEQVLETEAIDIVLQPIIDLRTGRPDGVEALARFAGHPPDAMFARAHRVGLGVDLELLAVRRAMHLIDRLPAHLSLSVNVGPATIISGRLAHELVVADPSRLIIELTENVRLDVLDESTLGRLRRDGMRLAIDDTGAGWAGLTEILRLRPDVIKLDRALTTGVGQDVVRTTLAEAIVRFSRTIGARVTAEGIETPGDLHALRRIGVPLGQGWILGRPVPVRALDLSRRPLARLSTPQPAHPAPA